MPAPFTMPYTPVAEGLLATKFTGGISTRQGGLWARATLPACLDFRGDVQPDWAKTFARGA